MRLRSIWRRYATMNVSDSAHAERIEAASALMLQAAQELTRAERAEIRFSTSDVLADLVAGPAISPASPGIIRISA
jgi:hypothetical protein